jgi:glutaconyl-CoA/methylmalonyl-CoA decarboxylase subunit gamma
MKIQVVINNQSYTVEVEDLHSRPVIATVQGERFEVWPEAPDTLSAAPTGAPAVSVPDSGRVSSALDAPADTSGGGHVVSPLPGVIVAILVKPGEGVRRGQELCTLEAMKMKNAIRANRDGAIASIEVNIGDQVGHGQVLITYAE